MKRIKLLTILFLFIVNFSYTNESIKKVVCTTSIIADAIQAIVQENMQVSILMRRGIDPHLYRPTPSALKAIQNADIIIHNGLHLEGNMTRIFDKLAPYKTILSVAQGIDVKNYIALSDQADSFDPHIWMNIPIWLSGIQKIVNDLGSIDKTNKEKYSKNFKKYKKRLMDLHQKNINKLNQIKPEQRVLITTHDAFSYFSKAYHFPVKALQGVSTQADFGIKRVEDLVNFIVIHKIKAIFVESSLPKKIFYNIQEACLQRGHHLTIAGVLYTDSLGISEADTYYKMLEFNTNLILNSLK